MRNFDKTKYPLDHNFVEYHIESEYLTNSEYNSSYFTFYRIMCTNCKIFIRHEENSILAYGDILHCWIPSMILFTEVDKLKFDYTKIYSCSEMMIKNLLE